MTKAEATFMNRRFILLKIILLSFMLCGCSTTYFGIVKDSQSLQPIPKIRIKAFYMDRKLVLSPMGDGAIGGIVETYTKKDGTFKIDIPEKPRTLWIEDMRYKSHTHYLYKKISNGEGEEWPSEKEIEILLEKIR